MAVNITNSIPATLSDLLVKLKILSMIESGQKINMGSMTFVDSSSWWGAIKRGLSGEGRKGLMVHINQIVQQAITAIGEYRDTIFCRLIVNSLAEAKIGIQSLITTYQDDPNIVAQINVCMSNIDIQLTEHRSLLDGHQNKAVSGVSGSPDPRGGAVPAAPISAPSKQPPKDQPPFGSNGVKVQ